MKTSGRVAGWAEYHSANCSKPSTINVGGSKPANLQVSVQLSTNSASTNAKRGLASARMTWSSCGTRRQFIGVKQAPDFAVPNKAMKNAMEFLPKYTTLCRCSTPSLLSACASWFASDSSLANAYTVSSATSAGLAGVLC